MGMELNHTNFAQVLEELRDTARLQGNMLTNEQLEEAFGQWKLDAGQMTLIQDYFRKHHIGIDESGNLEENLSGEDVNFLEMYLTELRELPPVSDGEKRAVMMSALAGDKNAQEKLLEIFWQGAFLEDLIGEGNVAAAAAVTMLECVESIDEVESFIGKMIMDAMEELISEDSDNRQFDENVLNKVNDVNDKARELYDNLLRKVTVGEVAKELGISEDEVREAMEFSANRIDYIAQ